MNRSLALLNGINSFCIENNLQEEDLPTCLYKFYIWSRDSPNFRRTISEALEDAQQGIQIESFMHILEFTTLMLELTPTYDQISFSQRDSILNHGLKRFSSNISFSQAQNLEKLLGKLLSHERVMKMINKIVLESNQFTRISTERDIEHKTILSLMRRKIEWETEKRDIFLVCRDEGTDIVKDIILNISNFFITKEPKLEEDKIYLLKIILKYNLDQMETSSQVHYPTTNMESKNELILKYSMQFAWTTKNCNLKFDLIYHCIKLLGVKDRSWVSEFIMKNIPSLLNELYLKLVNEILDQSSEKKILTKEVATGIMARIMYTFLKVQYQNHHESYHLIKEMCTIMLKISNIYVINYINSINKKLRDFSVESFQQIFLTSLLLFYDIHSSDQFLIDLYSNSQMSLQISSYQEKYNAFLIDFSHRNRIDDYLKLEVKKRNETILWELLTLRNSVITNYAWMKKTNLLNGILINLIQYALFDFFPKESSEIASMIIKIEHEKRIQKQKTTGEYQNVFEFFPLVPTLETINDYCLSNELGYSTNESLIQFTSILLLLRQQYNVECFEDLSLLTEVIKKIGIIFTVEKRVNSQLINSSIDLLYATLPTSHLRIRSQHLAKSMEMFLYLIHCAKISQKYLDIYLELLFNCKQSSQLTETFKTQDIFQQIQNQKLIAQNLSQQKRLNIAHFLLNDSRYTHQINQQCWAITLKALAEDELQICVFINKLFKVFDDNFKNRITNEETKEEYLSFLFYQLDQSLTFLSQLTLKVNEVPIAKKVIDHLEVLRLFQIYLFSTLQTIQNYNACPKNTLQSKMKSVFSEVLNYLDADKLVTNLCRKNEIGMTLKELWYLTFWLGLVLKQKQLSLSSLSKNGILQANKKIIQQYVWAEKIVITSRRNRQKRDHVMRAIIYSQAVPTPNIKDDTYDL